jgi:hypothetical protein
MFSLILGTMGNFFFCWIEGVEDAMVVVVFYASFEKTVKRMNFTV